MSKQESQMMKGVAILMMLFLHLFNQTANVDLCNNILLGGIPLVTILCKAADPVSFFLILGGYGLYTVNRKGDRHRVTRVIKLFIHYWIILTIFVTIGHFINPDKYPGNATTAIYNLTSFNTTYNREMWFLLPYVILSLCAPVLFRVMNRFRSITVIGVTLLLHICTCYCISRYGQKYLFQNMLLYNPFLVIHLLFSFSIGAMAARDKWFTRIKEYMHNIPYKTKNYIVLLFIAALVTLNYIFSYNFFYAFLIISALMILHIPNWLKTVLATLGDNSMNMWMIHTWFCYSLCHNFIYSFKYPILIFSVLTVISYITSLIVNFIARPIETRLMTRAEVNAKPIL